MTKVHLPAHRDTWRTEKHGVRSLCCLLLLHLHPRLGTNGIEAEPQPLPDPQHLLWPSLRCQNRAPSSAALPRPQAPGGSRAAGAGTLPSAGRPWCSPVPHNFVRPLGVYEGWQQQGESARNHCLIDTAVKAKQAATYLNRFLIQEESDLFAI